MRRAVRVSGAIAATPTYSAGGALLALPYLQRIIGIGCRLLDLRPGAHRSQLIAGTGFPQAAGARSRVDGMTDGLSLSGEAGLFRGAERGLEGGAAQHVVQRVDVVYQPIADALEQLGVGALIGHGEQRSEAALQRA